MSCSSLLSFGLANRLRSSAAGWMTRQVRPPSASTRATLVCALESFHGYPVYLVVLIMGGASLVIDAACGPRFAMSVLQHMPSNLATQLAISVSTLRQGLWFSCTPCRLTGLTC